jgi:hypothetical protein
MNHSLTVQRLISLHPTAGVTKQSRFEHPYPAKILKSTASNPLAASASPKVRMSPNIVLIDRKEKSFTIPFPSSFTKEYYPRISA